MTGPMPTSKLQAVKQEIVDNVGHDTWQKKVRTVGMGGLFVVIGLGVGYVGLRLALDKDALGKWLLGGGAFSIICGASIWDSEIMGAALKSVPTWIANAISTIFSAISQSRGGQAP